jgi:hypothetical protein
MPETFYGPWRVTDFGFPVRHRIVISGSENADGEYVVDIQAPLNLSVEGEKWTIEVDVWENSAWMPRHVRRRMEVLPETGLQVSLSDAKRWPFPNLDVFCSCTCLDPTINPPPYKDPPFDFKYTRRG